MGKERERAEAFAAEVEKTFGDALVAAVLYGSAARGDYREGVSDLNFLVLLDRVEPDVLRRGSALARKWVEQGNPPPLILGQSEWHRSADVFPIEYSDIRDAHIVLRGADPFAGVTIQVEHLRLQCEHELKGKQIQLRERYLLSAGEPKELGRLLHESYPTFLTLFRTVLRLAGNPVPRDPAAVIEAVSAEVGCDPEPWQEVRRSRAEGRRLAPAGDDPLVTGYLQGVARATEWLDRFRTPARTDALDPHR